MKTKFPIVLSIALLHFSFSLSAHAQSASSGTIITIAGGGVAGDGAAATNAVLEGPVDMAIGRDGTLFIYTEGNGNGHFRAVNPTSGIITTIAAGSDFIGLAADRSRNRLYFGAQDDDVAMQINLANNSVSLFAGVGWNYPYPLDGSDYRGDGGLATEAWFSFPPLAVGVDRAGNVFIAELNRLRKVDITSGVIQTIFGRADSCCYIDSNALSGDGGLAVNATGGIIRMAVDPAGDVFIIDNQPENPTTQHSRVRRIDAATGIINTIAGAGTNNAISGPAISLHLTNLSSIAVNDAGTKVFLGGISYVFQLDLLTGMLSPFAGDGTNSFKGDGGPALNAEFSSDGAHGLLVPPGGGLLISDHGNGRVRYVAPDSVTLTNNSGLTEFHLPWVRSLNGDLIITNNTNVTVVDAGSVTNVGGDIIINVGGSNTVGGALDLGSLVSAGGDVIINVGGSNTVGATINLGSLTIVTGNVIIDAGGSNTVGGTINLGSLTIVTGNVIIDAGGSNTVGGDLDLGSLTIVTGNVDLSGNGGTTTIDLGSVTTVVGSVTITNTGATNIEIGSLTNICGDITIISNAPDAVIDLNSLTTVGGCGTNDVVMTVDGTVMVTNGITLETNATLAGSATIDGSVTNNGTIAPGSSPGHLSFKRALLLKPSSRLRTEIAGYATNQYDSMSVAGPLTLGGNLSVTLLGNFPNTMTNGATFILMSSGSPVTGAFANVASGGTLTTADGRAQFTVVYAGENSVRLTNAVILPANQDSDGDGVSDANEIAAGTDPHNAASLFRLVSIQPETNGTRIFWTTVGGKTYRVQTNGSLSGNFGDFSLPIFAPGSGESMTNFLDAGTATNSNARYYRVRLGP